MNTTDQPAKNRTAARTNTRPFAVLAFLSIVALTFWYRISTVESAVDWQTDLPAALQAAADSDRLVLLNFSSPACMYCRRMEAEIFPQADVLAEIREFVPVKIDANANAEASIRYGIDPLPTYIVADAKGRPLARAEGYMHADEFIRFLRLGAAASTDQ